MAADKASTERRPKESAAASPARPISAPLLGVSGQSSREATLDESVFGSDVKAHLVPEAVRADLTAARAGAPPPNSRGPVAGGRGKPWRQKGTGRARAGTIRAPQWVG